MNKYEEVFPAFERLEKATEAYIDNMLDSDLRDAYLQATQRFKQLVHECIGRSPQGLTTVRLESEKAVVQ